MIEEKICKAAGEYSDLHGDLEANSYDDFVAGAKFALSHQWVSVEDALPNHKHLVLVLCDSEESELRYTTAAYKDGIWQYPDEWYYDVPVLMWMPIPTPPEARKEGEV